MIYDVIIIGAGIAGYEAACKSGNSKLKTLLVEKNQIGGTCLNAGCIPSKLFLSVAKELENFNKDTDCGILQGNIKINFKELVNRKNAVVNTLKNGILGMLQESHVDVLLGEAVIEGKENGHFIISVKDSRHYAKNLILATGSREYIPDIEGLQESLTSGFAVTNHNIFDMVEIPKSLTVIGGGVAGIEMAYFFKMAGCDVTVLEAQECILKSFDREIAQNLLKLLKQKGIRFQLSSVATEVKDGYVAYENEGSEEIIECDKVYCSVGRVANMDIPGMQSLGLETHKNFIRADRFGKTNVEHVYAIGDINGNSMLAHSASKDASRSIQYLLAEDEKVDMPEYKTSVVVYTHPECAVVGETEESLSMQGIKYSSVRLSMDYSGRYVTECRKAQSGGIIKLLIGEDDRILGAGIISNYASEIIMMLSGFITQGTPLHQIQQYIFPHPTEGEIIHSCIEKYKRAKKGAK